MPRYALLIAYDGRDFCGWWRQPGRRTVAGCLDLALQRLDEPAGPERLIGASRTDSGVHAMGQVAHLDCQREWEPEKLQRALDQQLDPDVACRAVQLVAEDFHACHSSVGKRYRYRCDAQFLRSPFLARTSWRVPHDIDKKLTQAAGDLWLGQHNLGAFARRGEHREEFNSSISQVAWSEHNNSWSCDIRADRFMLYQIRSMIGSMIAIGRGERSLDDLCAALAGDGDNPITRYQAPPRGLCLEDIFYNSELIWQH